MKSNYPYLTFLAVVFTVIGSISVVGVLFCLLGAAMATNNWQTEPLELAAGCFMSALLFWGIAGVMKVTTQTEANTREILYEMKVAKETKRPSLALPVA